jgi:hypothetical protein
MIRTAWETIKKNLTSLLTGTVPKHFNPGSATVVILEVVGAVY